MGDYGSKHKGHLMTKKSLRSNQNIHTKLGGIFVHIIQKIYDVFSYT